MRPNYYTACLPGANVKKLFTAVRYDFS